MLVNFNTNKYVQNKMAMLQSFLKATNKRISKTLHFLCIKFLVEIFWNEKEAK